MKTDIEDKVDVRGMAIIENLKDAFLLELEGTVKMHDVVCDVAIWISYPWMMDKNQFFGQGLARLRFWKLKFRSLSREFLSCITK